MRKQTAEKLIGSAEEEAKRIVKSAEDEGENRKKEKVLEAKEDVHRLRQDLEKETKDRSLMILYNLLAVFRSEYLLLTADRY